MKEILGLIVVVVFMISCLGFSDFLGWMVLLGGAALISKLVR